MSNELKPEDYSYTGDYQPEGEVQDPEGRRYYPYILSDDAKKASDLKEAVNLAIALGRPLLLEGEPGCGKTQLASALAYEYTQRHLQGQTDDKGNQRWWPFYTWHITSTTRGRDGLYFYDAVARLRDAQLMGSDPEKLEKFLGKDETDRLKQRLQKRERYRDFGPLGHALKSDLESKEVYKSDEWRHNYRPIVLIDEIDKADSDLPNDLLLPLDELRFNIPETDEKFPVAEQKPIIIITSNREKPLSEPFLRRCIYYFVEFPDAALLKEIVTKRFGKRVTNKKKLIDPAVKRFLEMRKILGNQPGLRQPGTSEFIEFVAALLRKPVSEARKDLENLADQLPLLGTVLKTQSAQKLYREALRDQDA